MVARAAAEKSEQLPICPGTRETREDSNERERGRERKKGGKEIEERKGAKKRGSTFAGTKQGEGQKGGRKDLLRFTRKKGHTPTSVEY